MKLNVDIITVGVFLLILQDMSSYVAVQGTPRKDNSFVFGLTPKEVRYLRVGGLLNSISDYILNPVFMLFETKCILGNVQETKQDSSLDSPNPILHTGFVCPSVTQHLNSPQFPGQLH